MSASHNFKEKIKGHNFFLIIKITITVVLLFWLFKTTSIENVANNFIKISLPTVIGCIIALFSINILTALRWKIVLRSFEAGIAFVNLWKYVMIGSFFNQFLPSGMGGDVFRIWYVRKYGLSLGKSLASVVVDRILGLLAVFILVVIGTPYLLSISGDSVVRNILLFLAVILAFGLVIFFRLDMISKFVRKFTVLKKFENNLRIKRLLDGSELTAINVRSMLQLLPNGPIAVIYSLVSQIIIGMVIYFLAIDLGSFISLSTTIFLFPYVLLVSTIPISLAGWGIREGSMVVVFSLVGMEASTALSVSIIFGGCLLASSLPGSIFWLMIYKSITKEDIREIGSI